MKLLAGTQSVISPDGLRYRHKPSGSDFGGGCGPYAVLSCYWCGRHKHPEDLRFERIAGKNQRVCLTSCRSTKRSSDKGAPGAEPLSRPSGVASE